MKIAVSLIRSGATVPGEQGRYVGRDDPPLTDESRAWIQALREGGEYTPARLVFCSPLLRCRETALIAYPDTPAILLDELCAYDYGAFTGRTYAEIVADARFRAWAESEQLLASPGGEQPHVFNSRCIAGFARIVDELAGKGLSHGAVITHRSVIRAILQRYYVPRSFYGAWTVENARETAVEFDPEHLSLRIIKKK